MWVGGKYERNGVMFVFRGVIGAAFETFYTAFSVPCS